MIHGKSMISGYTWRLAIVIVCGAANAAAVVSEHPLQLSADRLVAWDPGLMSLGGIPRRTTLYKTLSPSGGGDSAAIQAALNGAPADQVVMLNPGTFIVNNLLLIHRPITLRGSGAGVTKLIKTNGAKARTSIVIKGTNGILTPVNLGSYSYDHQPIIVVGPSRWNNGPDSTASQNLTADGAQGSYSVSAVNARDFKIGTFVLLDKSLVHPGSRPPRVSQAERKFGKAIVWHGTCIIRTSNGKMTTARRMPKVRTTRSPACCHDPCRGSREPTGQPEIKQIASISGNTVTFTSPLTISYRTSHQAQLTPYTMNPNTGGHAANNLDVHVTNAGVENLSIYGGTDGGLRFEAAAYSWAKAIEVTQWLGEGVAIDNSFRVELRNSYIHTGSWPAPGGAGYAISLAAGSSEVLIENNILIDTCKDMVFRSSGAGSVVAYNYADNSFDLDNPAWVEVGINASHMAGSSCVVRR